MQKHTGDYLVYVPLLTPC